MAWIFSLSAECGTKQTAAEQFSRYFERVSLILSNKNQSQCHTRIFQDMEDNWWCRVSPSGISEVGIHTAETAYIMTEIGILLYQHLRFAPKFRYALVGLEVDEFRTYSELLEETSPQSFPGLVLSETIWQEIGAPLTFRSFSSGYVWIPYQGEAYQPLMVSPNLQAKLNPIQLSHDSLEWAILHLEIVGDSDLFPRPAELDAVLAFREETKVLLSSADLSQLVPCPARSFIVPKANLSVRRATQLNLVDSIILTAIIYQYGNLIEQRRCATSENRVFSNRFKPDQNGWLYDQNFGWKTFWKTCYKRCSDYSHALVIDISDFYNQIDHRIVENQLIASGLPNQVGNWILRLLNSLTAKGSIGIPVGPHAAHLLAEATLIPFDNSLLSQGIDYLRYIDDLVVFANSEVEARKHLYRIAELLYKQQGLVLNRKTKILRLEDFKAHSKKNIEEHKPINNTEKLLIELIGDSMESSYKKSLIHQTNSINLLAFSSSKIEKIFSKYLSQKPVKFIELGYFLRKLTYIGHPGAIELCLKELDSLTPIITDVCHYLLAASINYQGDSAELGRQLLGMLSNELISSNEYLQICVLSLFAQNGSFNHFSKLTKLFDSSSDNLRREIILAARNCNDKAWLSKLKELLPSMDIWSKQAFLISAKILPIEERILFAQSVTEETLLDKILVKWIISKNSQKNLSGSISDRAAFMEALEYGRAFRQADRPVDEGDTGS